MSIAQSRQEQLQTHLHAANVLGLVLASVLPLASIGADADLEPAKNATEEFEVGKLDCVNADVVAKFDHHMLLLCRARRQHVAVLLVRKDGVW